MSSVYGVEPVKVVTGNQAYGAKKSIPVVDGPAQLSFQSFPAQSTNNSQLVFQINVPSLDTGVERAIIYELPFTATITGTSPAEQVLINGLTVGLSDSCADQIIATETCQIGQKSNSVQRSRCGVELSRVNCASDLLANFQSGSGGTYHDFATNFEPWLNSTRNPLAMEYDVPQNDYQPSPRTSDIWVTASNATSANFAGRIYFTSKVSPFLQSGIALPALRNLNVIQLQLQFEGILSQLLSVVVAGGYTITAGTGISVTIGGGVMNGPQVWCKFITPSKASLLNFTDADNIYDYNEIQVFTNTSTPAMAAVNNAGAVTRSTTTFNLQQISGSTIPDLMLIFCRPLQSMLPYNGATSPRWWLAPQAVGAINLKFNNTTVLNGCSSRQLYEMSLANGLTGVTFEQFTGRDVTYNQIDGGADATSYVLGGSPLILSPSRDFQISEMGLVNGTRANWALSGSILYQNQTYTDEANVELVVVCVYGGYLRSDGNVSAETGVLTREEVAKVTMSSAVPLNDDIARIYNRHIGYQGGASIFSKAVDLFKKHKDAIVGVAKSAYEHRDKLKSGLSHARKLIGRGEYDDDEDYHGGASLDTSAHAVASKRSAALSYMRR